MHGSIILEGFSWLLLHLYMPHKEGILHGQRKTKRGEWMKCIERTPEGINLVMNI